jgi:hypothetical protein
LELGPRRGPEKEPIPRIVILIGIVIAIDVPLFGFLAFGLPGAFGGIVLLAMLFGLAQSLFFGG